MLLHGKFIYFTDSCLDNNVIIDSNMIISEPESLFCAVNNSTITVEPAITGGDIIANQTAHAVNRYSSPNFVPSPMKSEGSKATVS